MQAKIIAVVNQKGGPGKTTLSMQLGGTLARRNRKILIGDADPQGTASRWAAAAEDGNPFPAAVAGFSGTETKVHREVQKFVQDYEFIIIDCPPAVDSPIPQSALLVADLALVPVVPSPPDLWAGVGIRKLIENAAAVNEHLKARLVINQMDERTSLAKQVAGILSKFGVSVCENRLGNRVAFREAAAVGGTVHSCGSGAGVAVEEIEALTDEILSVLEQGVSVNDEEKLDRTARKVASG